MLPELARQDAEDVRVNEPDDVFQEAVDRCARWFDKDKEAKDSITREMYEYEKLQTGRHWDLLDETGHPLRSEQQKSLKPNAVENIAFALVDGLASEFAMDVELIDIPTEPGDDDAATKMTQLKRFIAQKNRIKMERLDFTRNYFGLGTGIWHIYWDPDWKGGRGPNRWIGDIRWKSQHPLTVFPDARCGDDINNGYRIHKAVYVPLEYIAERWPEYADQVQAETPDPMLLLGTDDEELTSGETEELVLLVETWYRGKPLLDDPDIADGDPSEASAALSNDGNGLHCIWWAGEGQRVYLGHANYVCFRGEEPRFPFIFRQRYPRKNSVWGYSEYHYVKSPQIILNKTTEMILEGHQHHALGRVYYTSDALDDEHRAAARRLGGIPGAWINVKDLNGINHVFGTGVPGSLQGEPLRIQRAMETIVGRFDISQGRTPGSVTAFRALDLLNQRAQVRLRSAETDITTAYEDCGRYINQLVVENYTEGRVYRILGDDDGAGPQFDTFDLADIQKVHVFEGVPADLLAQYNLPPGTTVIPFRGWTPPEGMIEGQDYEVYSPDFDVECRTTTGLPSDRIFYMEVAKELLALGKIDDDVFWHVMEHGKFPPFAEMAERARERALMAKQMAMAQAQAQGAGMVPPAQGAAMPMGGTPEAGPGAGVPSATGQAQDIARLIEQLPAELQDELLSLTPDEQIEALTLLLEQIPQPAGPM